MNILPLEELIWQVENYLAEKNITSFDFNLFGSKEKMIGADLKPIMAALALNTHFQDLIVLGLKLHSEGYDVIGNSTDVPTDLLLWPQH